MSNPIWGTLEKVTPGLLSSCNLSSRPHTNHWLNWRGPSETIYIFSMETVPTNTRRAKWLKTLRGWVIQIIWTIELLPLSVLIRTAGLQGIRDSGVELSFPSKARSHLKEKMMTMQSIYCAKLGLARQADNLQIVSFVSPRQLRWWLL